VFRKDLANNILTPSWPFHFKEFERVAVVSKGRRVSDPDPSGYIATWSEGNCYGIRALKQELFRQRPTQQPILLTSHLESEIAQAAAIQFGLEWHRIDLEEQGKPLFDTISLLTSNGQRPIIFAATLANTMGQSDDLEAVDSISRIFPLILHVDACRVFDYLTTASEELRRDLGLPSLRLHHTQLGTSGCVVDGEILAATIVAGGSNAFVFPPPVVVLKPRLLGSQSPAAVEYVRGTDSTLAGSRDSLGPLMLCLQELRFGDSGLRDIYESCALKRLVLMEELRTMKVQFYAHRYSLDVRISVADAHTAYRLAEMGAKALGNGNFLLALQPSVRVEDIKQLLQLIGTFDAERLSGMQHIQSHDFASTYTLPDGVATKIWDTVQQFKIKARSSCDYPLNQAPYSALGPVIGPFLTVRIPDEWARVQAANILNRRKKAFGLHTKESQESFRASFTTGSTMGNRIGLHTALTHHPKAFVYFSSASHYSVKKTVSDCDNLSNHWSPGRVPRFAEIPADDYGRMIPEVLVRQVLSDRAECNSHDETYELILFANLGTTFVGGRDDLVEIRRQLEEIGVRPAHIHVDGALDMGFLVDGVRLGPPSVPCTNNGIPVVQGVTISHHKVFGIMVSGQVVCYSPNASESLAALTLSVEPRAVFEMWLFEQTYLAEDLVSIKEYCLENAYLLRKTLASSGVPIRFNENCIITLLERPPPWLIKEFQLAPEGDWVHFITMPHISPATVDRFARAVALIDIECATAFDYVESSLSACLKRRTSLKRVTCRSPFAGRVLDIAMTTLARLQNVQEELEVITVNQLWARYISSTMSFIAVDENDEPQAVFLAEAGPGRLVKPSVILVRSPLGQSAHMLRDIGMQLYGHVATLMNVNLDTRRGSYEVISYMGTTL
jgi:glutamate/tyrosine decarboxylase-like PLP-dependent enzyme